MRQLLIGCVLLAVVVGAAGQLLSPAPVEPLLTWLDAAAIPAIVAILLLAYRGDRVRVLALVCALLYVESLLTARLFVIGMAFAIVVPVIGIGLLQPHVRGRALLAAYVGAGAVATLSVAIVQAGQSANGLDTDQPALTVVAFGLVTVGALGLLWRASQRQIEALDDSRREVAARTAAEQQLARTADALGSLIRSSPVAVIAFDAARIPIVWNPAAERLFGWAADEILGRRLPEAIEPLDDSPGIRSVVDRIAAGDIVAGERVRGRHRDGHEVIAELHGTRGAPAGDDPGGPLIEAIDVTDRVVLEERLQQARKMEAVGQLAGGIAHDINNMLTAVGGFAEIIADEAPDPEIRTHASTITQSVERARVLTHRLLAFARRSVLRPQDIEIDAWVPSVEGHARAILGPTIQLTVELAAEGARVRVDPGELDGAIGSLLSNARDAMPDGGVVTVRTSRATRRQGSNRAIAAPVGPGPGTDGSGTDGPGTDGPETAGSGTRALAVDVVISVVDTGVGIAPEIIDQVFEPFFTTKGRGRAEGMGLAMVYGFVAQSGGTIDVRSTTKEGTVVEIRLPEVILAASTATEAAQPEATARADPTVERTPPMVAAQPEVASDAGRAEAGLASAGADRASRVPTVLVIDDEPDVLELERRTLARLGYDVLVAGDGDSAIALARNVERPIDLIVSDVLMRGRLGPEVVAAITAVHSTAAVLYVSGFSADAIANRGVLSPGVELLEKPFSAAALSSRVQAILAAG